MENQQDIITIIERMCNSYKNPYLNMKNFFDNNKLYKDNIIVFNIEDIVKLIKHFGDYEKINQEKVKNIELFIAISILNIISHYRHFFYSKLNKNNTFIIYMKSEEFYKKNTLLINILTKICNLLPNIFVIPSLLDNNLIFEEYTKSIYLNNFYNHIIINLINQLKKETNNQISLHILSEDKISYEILNHSDSSFLYRRVVSRFLINNLEDIWDNLLLKNSKIFYQITGMKPYLDIMIPNLLAIFGYNKENRILNTIKFKFKLNKNKMDKLLKFIKSRNNIIPLNNNDLKEFDVAFGKSFELNDEDYLLYIERIKNIRYEYHEIPKIITEQLLIAKKNAIHDDNISDINLKIQDLFPGKRFNLKWLFESKIGEN